MTTGVVHLSVAIGHLYIFFWRNVYSSPLPIVELGWFVVVVEF
jgi:hypothetical protein